MDEVSGRREHRFASQRTGFEGLNVVVEHLHGVVDKLLGQAHTPVVNRIDN